MGRQLDRAQIDWLQLARVGAVNFSANGNSNNITSAITTVLSTAGDGGVSVPLQAASTSAPGVQTTGADNLAIIISNATKKPIANTSNQEVYGRITESSNVYTLSYFVLNNGTETAYNFGSATAIDFFFSYLFDAYRYPRNAAVAIPSRIIQQDPDPLTASNVRTPERINVTATNTLAALSQAPSTAGNIILYVNGKAEFATGSSPSFSVSGTTITWSVANAGYSLTTLMEVYAVVW